MAESAADSPAQLVRELIEAWNAGQRERLLEHLDPEAEIRTIRSQLEGRAYRGTEGFQKALADFDEDWEYVRFALEELQAEGDFVALRVRVQSKGKASGIELDVPIGWLWEFRKGRIVRLESYSEPEDAFGAARLRD